MGEVIQLREFQQARRRDQNRANERLSLQRAIEIMIENLAAVAIQLRDAPVAEQPELLERIEHLSAMIRYSKHMLGEPLAAISSRGPDPGE